MKKIVATAFIAFGLIVNVNAQAYQSDLELVKSVQVQAKENFIEDAISIPDRKSLSFWELHNDYEVERKRLEEHCFKLANNYALFQGLSSQDLDKDFMKKVLKLQRKADRNIRKYYRKLDRN